MARTFAFRKVFEAETGAKTFEKRCFIGIQNALFCVFVGSSQLNDLLMLPN